MKIIVIGASGTIGKAVVSELSKRHTVVTAGRQHGDVSVDITDLQSIKKMYDTVGAFDAVVMATGRVHFGALNEMTTELYQIGLQNKLLGQVNVVLTGLPFISDRGSFTLTSGILSRDPIRYGSSAAMVNGAIDCFVKASAIELPRGIRINSISPTIITESMKDIGDYFIGFDPVPAARVALAYAKSVDGLQTGQTYQVGY